MAIPDVINADVQFNGTVSLSTVNLPASSVSDANIKALSNVAASKLQHQYEPVYRQSTGSSAAVDRQVLHVVYGATATILAFRVGAAVAAIGAATVTVDLKKNGSTILTATITVDSTLTAYSLRLPSGYTSTALVAGDVLEVDVTNATAGGGTLPKGLFAQLIVTETAQ